MISQQFQQPGHLKGLYLQYKDLFKEQLLLVFEKQKTNQDLDRCYVLLDVMAEKGMGMPPEAPRIREVYQNLIMRLKTMHESTEGWRVDKFGENDECTISTNVISSGRVLVRFDGQLKINVFNLASMVYETDLFPEWVPFCDDCQNLKTIPKASKIVRIGFSLPIISKREGLMFGQGVDRIDHSDSVAIYCESITGSQALQKLYDVSLQIDTKSVTLDMKFFVCEITIVKKGLYRFRAFADVDLNVRFLPGFVLGILTKKVGNWVFGKMLGIANNIQGTKYQKRIQEDTEGFYKWLGQRLAKFDNKGL